MAKKSNARKTSTLPTRIWSFHAKAPIDGAEACREIFWRSRRYYNALIEIERRRRDLNDAVRNLHVPEISELEKQLEITAHEMAEVVEDIKRDRAKGFRGTGVKTRDTAPAQALRLQLLRVTEKVQKHQLYMNIRAFELRLKPTRARFKQRKDEIAGDGGPHIKAQANAQTLTEMLADPDVDTAWKSIATHDANAVAEHKQARAKNELPSACGGVVDTAAEQAIKDSFPERPRFKSFDGGGKIAVQTKDLTWRDASKGRSQWLRMQERATLLRGPDGKPVLFRGEESYTFSRKHYICWVRIGTNADRSPVWAQFPVKLHREPPNDAVIKWAWIRARKQGEKLNYELQLTMEHESFGVQRPAGVGEANVSVGWAKRADGSICVAQVNGEEVLVPPGVVSSMGQARTLKSYADTHYSEALKYLRKLLFLTPGARLPHWEWMASDRKRLRLRDNWEQWARQLLGDKLKPLWGDWRAKRASTDLYCRPQYLKHHTDLSPSERVAFWFFIWAKKDRHLREWEAEARRHGEAARDEVFRKAAIRLATQYQTMVHDGLPIAELAKLAEVDERNVLNPEARAQRVVSAPGRFREVLIETFGKHRVIKRESEGAMKKTAGSRVQKRAKKPVQVEVVAHP